MKAVLLTGICALLLAMPTDAFALGLAEYGQEMVGTDGPALEVSRLNAFRNLFADWQAHATYCSREVAPLFCRVSQLLLAVILLTGSWLGRRQGLQRTFVKARRSVGNLKINAHGRGLLSA